ncbi:hypothetical protein HN873_029135, partial [Arachis hypogaea]
KVESEPNSSGAGSSSGGAVVEEVSVQRVKKEEVNAKISAWQNNKIAKINNRFKRKDAVIEGWESEQTNKLYQLLSNNPVAFCLLVAWARGNALEKCTWFKIQDSRRMYLVQVGSWDRWVKAPTPMMSRPNKVTISEASSNLTDSFIVYYYAGIDMHIVVEGPC